ncbi:CHAD domain-containing protein [Bradyrhizobium sp.]|uniref:CHAD domain-containing protein n=1 Tax=Bradyrhizobium sp. TaxID=376 RepID=UPI0025BC3340|nr:CHAD domain-containing protein [Bradyrhizobium sp.]
MACDTAFRVVARRCLLDLTANHAATCRGDPEALHQMRVALARLRTAISFFSPMVSDPQRMRIRRELKWLHTHLGTVRDLDVAIERIETTGKVRPQDCRSWKAKRAERHRRLAHAIRSPRYRHLIKDASDWVESGPWAIKKGTRSVARRAFPIAAYSADKLMRWQEKLVKKSRKLRDLGVKKRHRLRLLNKKCHYSTEFFADLFGNEGLLRQRAALKYLRRAQKALGELNDVAKGQSLAAALERDGIRVSLQFPGRKRQERLIHRAAAAYRKLAALKPLRV